MFLKEKLEENLCDLVLDKISNKASMNHKILKNWISLKLKPVALWKTVKKMTRQPIGRGNTFKQVTEKNLFPEYI